MPPLERVDWTPPSLPPSLPLDLHYSIILHCTPDLTVCYKMWVNDLANYTEYLTVCLGLFSLAQTGPDWPGGGWELFCWLGLHREGAAGGGAMTHLGKTLAGDMSPS